MYPSSFPLKLYRVSALCSFLLTVGCNAVLNNYHSADDDSDSSNKNRGIDEDTDSETAGTQGDTHSEAAIDSDTGNGMDSDDEVSDGGAAADSGSGVFEDTASSDAGDERATESDDTEMTDSATETSTETGTETESVAPPLRLCLSPGHPSSEGNNLYEAIINRKVAFYLEALLLAAGYDVLIAVEDISKAEIFAPDFDNEGFFEQSLLVPVSLNERVDICNSFEADYFIALHHNAIDKPESNYTMTLYAEEKYIEEGDERTRPYSEDTVEWARLTTSNLLDVMSVTHGRTEGDRSFLGIGLTVLQDTAMPAILTEASFVTHPAERLLLNQNDYLEGEAGAIFDGFVDFRKMQEAK